MAFENLRQKRGTLRQQEHESTERTKVHDARYSHGDERDTRGLDARFAETSMKEIWRDERMREQYRNVGFHSDDNKLFLSMFTKMQDIEAGKDVKLTDEERGVRETVRREFVYRAAIAKACDKLLVKDIFKGVGDANLMVNRLVGEVGEKRALELIKPRLLNLVGEPQGTEDLQKLHQALRQMHGLYASKDYQKVSASIEQIRKRYNLSAEDYADLTRGGDVNMVASRVHERLQEGLGFFGRLRHSLPDYIRGMKVGAVAQQEELAQSMRGIRNLRNEALEVISHVLDEDFFKNIDKEIVVQDEQTTDEALASRENENATFARGMTLEDMTAKRDAAWAERLRTNPAENTEPAYDAWVKKDFLTAQRKDIKERGQGRGWLATLVAALFDTRWKEMKKPAF